MSNHHSTRHHTTLAAVIALLMIARAVCYGIDRLVRWVSSRRTPRLEELDSEGERRTWQ